jgi:hypothetical protein
MQERRAAAALPQATGRHLRARTRFQSSWQAHFTPLLTRCLTTLLSGRLRCRCRGQTRPTMSPGPLQRAVRRRVLVPPTPGFARTHQVLNASSIGRR